MKRYRITIDDFYISKQHKLIIIKICIRAVLRQRQKIFGHNMNLLFNVITDCSICKNKKDCHKVRVGKKRKGNEKMKR